MTTKVCPDTTCGHEFETPVIVNNFTFTPKKETYYACPYCLTPIEHLREPCTSIQEEKKQPITISKDSMEENDEDLGTVEIINQEIISTPSIEHLRNLEKEKRELLIELNSLRENAQKKIELLQNELLDLKNDSQKLRKILEK